MKLLFIATRNSHKVQEIQSVLGDRFHYTGLNDYPDAPEVEETAHTFAGNATKKAAILAQWLVETKKIMNGWVMADDSGLEVDFLHGQPGVHSARFAALDVAGMKGNSSDKENNAKLLRLMQSATDRKARFRCVIALASLAQVQGDSPEETAGIYHASTRLFDGVCEGVILEKPSGLNGFGYDPLFVPNGYSQTFAELGAEIKNKISHRAKALAKVVLDSNAIG